MSFSSAETVSALAENVAWAQARGICMPKSHVYLRSLLSKHRVDECTAADGVPAAERHLLHLLSQAVRTSAVHGRTMDFPAQLEPVQASAGQIRWFSDICQPRGIERQLLHARDGPR